ncbi:insulinase family protein [bacterium]|nr:insulinase family protein [bacterium]
MRKILTFLLLFYGVGIMAAMIKVPIETLTLDNGLRVYLSKNSATPTVAVAMYYDVGSRDELAGKTGFAHLFEHMMFQGSRNVDKAEHFKYIENNGGQMNGTTSRERTNYYEILPSNQLELALWLEADRMESLMVNNINFENQRAVVKEEKLSSYDNRPYGLMFPTLEGMAYENPQYSHPVIGSVEDLDNAKVEDAQKFFKQYYNPNNAVLVICGDFDLEKAKSLVKKYFGNIKNSEEKKNVVDFTEPKQKAKKSKKIEDKLAKLPALAIAYKAPSALEADFYALSMLETILFNTSSSRLYQKLVKEKELALSISGGINLQRGPNLFYIYSITKKGNVDKVKKIIYDEIEKIKKEGISDDELAKAKNRVKTDFVFQLQSNLNRALQIGTYALYFNKPELIETEYELYEKVTKEDVKEAVKKYFGKESINELEVVVK